MRSIENLVIDISRARFTYPDRLTLRLEEFKLRRGGFALVIGPNGAGKSTFCKLLAGMLRGYVVDVEEGGRWVIPPMDPILVWQEQVLFPTRVGRNLEIVNADQSRVDELLQIFRLGTKRNEQVSKLSGGERERLAIARALAVPGARVIIFDEPTQSIDAELVPDIKDAIVGVLEQGIAAIVVTHDVRLVSMLSLREPDVYFLDPIKVDRSRPQREQVTDSTLTEAFTVKDLFDRPRSLYAAQFAGYENIFQVTSFQSINADQLRPLEKEIRPQTRIVVVPPEALSVVGNSEEGRLWVQRESTEFRGGGVKVCRYRRNNNGAEFVVSEQHGIDLPENGFLGVDGSKCIQITI